MEIRRSPVGVTDCRPALFPKMEGLTQGSMLDLKTIFRARKYARRILNSLGKNDEEFLIDDRIFQIAEIGRIHAKAA